ncbi:MULTISPECIES: STAS/SEC14 domain-containing protein [unclassified Bradyrhizobium]|uniref:STAS/SEC14 domain-containing protein n=1 Tax=Bradyrhizobium japonicum TaxID=375 RepID=A0A1Y2JX60_BRAJP|nr:hypothetical protein BSZ19_02765 [Bradyrhizobium japonicum]TFW52528.1 STAS/SEC14 domain-containing protein [Bradyrhizobium sp. MOS001]
MRKGLSGLGQLKLVGGYHRQVKRVVVVTDSELFKAIPRMAKHFVSAQVRRFSSDQKAETLAWLEAQ